MLQRVWRRQRTLRKSHKYMHVTLRCIHLMQISLAKSELAITLRWIGADFHELPETTRLLRRTSSRPSLDCLTQTKHPGSLYPDAQLVEGIARPVHSRLLFWQ